MLLSGDVTYQFVLSSVVNNIFLLIYIIVWG